MPTHQTQRRRSLLGIAAAAAILGFVLPPASPAGAQGQAGRPSILQRTTLVVGDIEKSIDFYQRLGLLKVADITGTDADPGGVFGAADLPLTADSKASRLVYLQSGDSVLALLSYDRPQLPSARGNLVGIGIGDIIVTIDVTDLQGAYARLGQIGTRFQRTPIPFTMPGLDGKPLSGVHMLAYDPDGHMVQISQMDRR